jgi:hypothetical protein
LGKISNICKEIRDFLVDFLGKEQKCFLISDPESNKLIDFSPIVLKSHEGKKVEELESCNVGIDKYFQGIS